MKKMRRGCTIECDYTGKYIECRKREEKMMIKKLGSRNRLVQKQKRRERIRELKYNASYERIIVEVLPKYRRRESKRKVRMRVCFKCKNEERKTRF